MLPKFNRCFATPGRYQEIINSKMSPFLAGCDVWRPGDMMETRSVTKPCLSERDELLPRHRGDLQHNTNPTPGSKLCGHAEK